MLKKIVLTSLPLLLVMGALLVTPKPVHAFNSHLIPITDGYCDVVDGHPVLSATWSRLDSTGLHYYHGTFTGSFTSICYVDGPLSAAQINGSKTCKPGICCHWTTTNPASSIYVDDNNNPIGEVWVLHACTDTTC